MNTDKPLNLPVLHDAETIRAYFSLWLEQVEVRNAERDRRYEERFRSQETAVAAALAAQQKAVADALVAQEKLNVVVQQGSERAITKAEIAQQGVNERGNEFRQSLDDYTKLMLPRTESTVLLDAMAATIGELRKELTNLREELRKEIQSLREYRSVGEGKETAHSSDKLSSQWITGIIISVVLGGIGTIIGVIELFRSLAK